MVIWDIAALILGFVLVVLLISNGLYRMYKEKLREEKRESEFCEELMRFYGAQRWDAERTKEEEKK